MDTLKTFIESEKKRYKYPRTQHAPWSPGTSSDDRILKSVDHFIGKKVVITEKMDAENTSCYRDHLHARSLDSGHHPSRTVIKQLHAQFRHDLPIGWRVCGENMYATHSLHYDKLPSYFLVFSIWNEKNFCLPWDETKEWCELLGLHTVPELYVGIWNEEKAKACWTGISKFGSQQEGYVARTFEGFPYSEFATHVMKFVRKGHVQTSELWMNQPVVPNQIAK